MSFRLSLIAFRCLLFFFSSTFEFFSILAFFFPIFFLLFAFRFRIILWAPLYIHSNRRNMRDGLKWKFSFEAHKGHSIVIFHSHSTIVHSTAHSVSVCATQCQCKSPCGLHVTQLVRINRCVACRMSKCIPSTSTDKCPEEV